MKFKIGDRVKYYTESNYSNLNDCVGTIEAIANMDGTPYLVCFTNRDISFMRMYWCMEDHLKLEDLDSLDEILGLV